MNKTQESIQLLKCLCTSHYQSCTHTQYSEVNSIVFICVC